MKLKRGVLIAVEGIDGSGKSTLVNNLKETFSKHNLATMATKEPGGSKIGIALRTFLQERPIPLCPKAEFLLFVADRAQHFEEKIIPALNENKLVISDRMADSSLAYNGYGRGLDRNMIRTINTWAMNERQPDLVVYIRIPLEIAITRIQERGSLSTFEKEAQTFLQKTVDGYEEIFSNQKNVITVDGTLSPEEVTSYTLEVIHAWLTKNNLLKQ